MMKKFLLLVLLWTLAGCTPSEPPRSGKPHIVASFCPMVDFTRKIAGEHAVVTCVIPDGMDMHEWEPSPADVVEIQKADGFVYNGAGMEHWVPALLDSMPGLREKSVCTSRGITLCGEHACEHDHHDHAHDHDHHTHAEHAPDPHVWLAPANAKKQMENILHFLVKLDPAHEADYTKNYAKYAAQCDQLDAEWKATVKAMPVKTLLVTHEAFGYLCAAYGLEQEAVEGAFSNSEPDPAKMIGTIRLAKEKGIRVVYVDSESSSKVAHVLAREIGGEVRVLNPMGRLSREEIVAGEDYFSLMRKNMAALK
ncbi:MAG: zinc ABC transporter substrate-binding protein [Planctomycetia bacterium]|nr:zinc ABC transporter substrate-binding protein [Planctomycetia bacterium]